MNEGNERARWIKMSAQLQQGGEGGCRMHASGMKCVWQGGEGGSTSARPGAADASGFRLKARQPSRGAIR